MAPQAIEIAQNGLGNCARRSRGGDGGRVKAQSMRLLSPGQLLQAKDVGVVTDVNHLALIRAESALSQAASGAADAVPSARCEAIG
jgi:hypothetical protein